MSIELKQIVYNLEDYGGSGGLISTNKNNHNELIYSMVYQNRENDSTETTLVGDLGLTDYMENRIDIFDKNILANYTNVKKQVFRLLLELSLLFLNLLLQMQVSG